LRDQGGPVTPVQTIEHQHRHLRLAGPGRLEFGPKCHVQQHRQAAHTLYDQVEEFARGWVDPMRIFENHRHGLLPRLTLELPDQRFQRAPARAANRLSR
jgi:hypothetical protein